MSSLFRSADGRTPRRLLIVIVFIAFLLRVWAVVRLPVDFDEPVYLEAAFDYAQALRAGNFDAIIDYAGNPEHPPLVKLLYGAGIVSLGEYDSWEIALFISRALSAVFGILAVLVLTLVDPLAGALLAIHTLVVKYTSQAYLEALSLFTSLAAVLAFQRAKAMRGWRFWLSAVALGLTAAGKYSYFPIAFVILYLALWEKKLGRWLMPYVAVAAGAFWLFNPSLWHDPVGRLTHSLFFHLDYSQSAHVQASGYPWYQPVYWISRSVAVDWHPEVFLYPGLDGLIFLLALSGLYLEWQKRRWVVVWFIVSLTVLLVWPTKWPQYTLVLIPPLCLSAASAVRWGYRRLRENEDYWTWFQQMVPAPPRSFWIIGSVLVVALVTAFVVNTAQVVLGRLGWSHYVTANTPLPSNTIYAVLSSPGGRMVLGTERGAVILEPPAGPDSAASWMVFDTENAGLPNNRVRAVARDQAGNLWFGTEAGLSRYDGTTWRTYRATDFDLSEDKVQTLDVDGDDRLWAGTSAGAAVFDEGRWATFTATTSGLIDDNVTALAAAGDAVWFGTSRGISRLDTTTGEWTSTNSGELGSAGVADLLVDSRGRLWVATLGGGLGLWNGEMWQAYRVSNSDIPSNTVQTVFEVEPGVIWVGTASPTELGGALTVFDGESWTTYTPRNAGYSGAEPLAMGLDGLGRLWIGTRTAGVDVYQLPH